MNLVWSSKSHTFRMSKNSRNRGLWHIPAICCTRFSSKVDVPDPLPCLNSYRASSCVMEEHMQFFCDVSKHLPYYLHQYNTSEISFYLWKKYHFYTGHCLWEAALLECQLRYTYQSLTVVWRGPSTILPPGSMPSDVPPAYLTVLNLSPRGFTSLPLLYLTLPVACLVSPLAVQVLVLIIFTGGIVCRGLPSRLECFTAPP